MRTASASQPAAAWWRPPSTLRAPVERSPAAAVNVAAPAVEALPLLGAARAEVPTTNAQAAAAGGRPLPGPILQGHCATTHAPNFTAR